MKLIILTALLAANIVMVSGCASPAEMRATEPVQNLISTKEAKQVAFCIANKWENVKIQGSQLPVNMRPTEYGFTLSIINQLSGGTELLVDVREEGSGSRTIYYQRKQLGTGPFDQAVLSCQN